MRIILFTLCDSKESKACSGKIFFISLVFHVVGEGIVTSEACFGLYLTEACLMYLIFFSRCDLVKW